MLSLRSGVSADYPWRKGNQLAFKITKELIGFGVLSDRYLVVGL
jgi:hypothetical protein